MSVAISWANKMQLAKCDIMSVLQIQAHIPTYIHIHTYIHTYVRTYIHTYIHKYIHAYIYIMIRFEKTRLPSTQQQDILSPSHDSCTH